VLRVYREHLEDCSRRTLYYRVAYDRVTVALVEMGLLDRAEADHERYVRHPIPLRVMFAIGKASRAEPEMQWLAERCLTLRRLGWTADQLLWWIRDKA
jgi:hypothetical protein